MNVNRKKVLKINTSESYQLSIKLDKAKEENKKFRFNKPKNMMTVEQLER